MKKLSILLVVSSLFFAFSPRLNAFLPGGPLRITTNIVVNPVEGPAVILCDKSEIIKGQFEYQWWASIDKPVNSSAEKNPLSGIPAECGAGTFSSLDDDGGKPAETPYILSAGSTIARIIRQVEDERVVDLKVTSQINLSRQSDDGQAEDNEVSDVKRDFFFFDDREVFIPLFIASNDQQETLGIREIFLRVALSEQLDAPGSVYGKIWVSSEIIDAEVMLDGGKVGKISTPGDLLLSNVKTGEHEVSLRSADGVQTRKVVHVRAGRTVLVNLNLNAGPESSPNYQLSALAKNVQGYEEYQRVIDGAVVIKIPEGEFLMGNDETERSPLEHNVYLSSFLMDKTGVTWGQYKLFAEATGITLPPHDPYWGILDDHPVVFVTWEEARNYCQWAGGRLPTEAEREKAARGTDGRKYPWGNEEPRPDLAIFRKSWGYHSTGAVGQHPEGASPYGLLDMGGNVWEWCADWYDRDYYEMSPYRDPKGPAFGTAHVVRGGSWDSRPTVLSSSCRSWGHPGYRDGDFGFRCAMNSPE